MPGARAGILMVDDRPENLMALEAVLEPMGQRLIAVDSGEAALKRLLKDDVALILLDVEMPGLDGFETAEHIKRRARSRHIPIIFMTAVGREREHALRGYAAGAADYLVKPFDPTVLRAKVGVFIELHRLRAEAQDLAHRALHDGLTGLPNRVLFVDRLEMALARMQRRAATVGVLFLDLDGFKAVNDRLGHEAGDELLVQVAERLRRTVRPADTVARFGGDEFAILSEGHGTADELEVIAGRVCAALGRSYPLARGTVEVRGSIGIALASEPGAGPETLIREADAAMYRAKGGGGGGHEMFDAEMRTRATQRQRLEAGLREAVSAAQLRVHYQPKVRLDSGRVTGVEALLRWQHPERGLLGPVDFMAVAEQKSLIVPIGAWVLREALAQSARWRARDGRRAALEMAVNLSARQLAEPDLAEVVRGALRETGTDPATLCLEVTESVAMEDAASCLRVLGELKALGVRIAIDDFGTGYSSLSYLRRFPVDVLKIDRSFVQDLGRDPQSASIAGAVVSLAHALGLSVVAEGVETRDQLRELRALDCDRAQGFLFARPQAPEALDAILERGTAPFSRAEAAPVVAAR